MKLPWNKNTGKDPEKEKLETKLEEKQEKIRKLQNMLEAEKKRRSKLAKEKQDAEEKLNRLKDKIEGIKSTENAETNVESDTKVNFEGLDFADLKDSLEKLGTVKSQEKDLITVYSPRKLSEHSQITDIKNSIPEKILSPLMDKKSLILFYTDNLGLSCFKVNSFYREDLRIEDKFLVNPLIDFMDTEKYWTLISRGDSKVFKEENGTINEIENFKNRVNRQHGKGGFSQGRFERKRDEQIQSHLQNVKTGLKELDSENLYILGEKDLCSSLPGKYVSGFDPNQSDLKNFYQALRLKTSIS